MISTKLADIILIIHLLFVIFSCLGGLLVLVRARIIWLHLPALAWGIWIEFSGGICPLTPLENHFRRSAGQAGYDDGFIAHYILQILYPAGLTPAIQWMLGGILILLNMLIYALVISRRT